MELINDEKFFFVILAAYSVFFRIFAMLSACFTWMKHVGLLIVVS